MADELNITIGQHWAWASMIMSSYVHVICVEYVNPITMLNELGYERPMTEQKSQNHQNETNTIFRIRSIQNQSSTSETTGGWFGYQTVTTIILRRAPIWSIKGIKRKLLLKKDRTNLTNSQIRLLALSVLLKFGFYLGFCL